MRSILDTRPKGAPGRDKPVPYGSLRHAAVGATLVVARRAARGFAATARDKPFPYGLVSGGSS